MSFRHSRNGVGASTTSNLIALIAVRTITIPILVVSVPFPNLTEDLPAVAALNVTPRSSRCRAANYSLPMVDTLAAPVLGIIL